MLSRWPATSNAPVGKPVRLSSHGRLSVMAELHYQPALHAVVGGRDAFGFTNAVSTVASLIPEPECHRAAALRLTRAGLEPVVVSTQLGGVVAEPGLEDAS